MVGGVCGGCSWSGFVCVMAEDEVCSLRLRCVVA